MNHTIYKQTATEDQLRTAAKKIAPVWQLASFVAVNPYMALIDKPFEQVAEQLAKIAGTKMTMPISYYAEKLEKGILTEEDWQNALSKAGKTSSVKLKEVLIKEEAKEKSTDFSEKILPTVISTASKLSQNNWERFVQNHISLWASAYFDEGQAIWKQPKEASLYTTWKKEAEIDRLAEYSSADLKEFRKAIKHLPDNAIAATDLILKTLSIPEEGLDSYLHRVLHLMPGWAAYAARIDWEAVLYGGKDGVLIEFLAVLLSYEYAFFQCYQNKGLMTEWEEAKIKILEASSSTEASEHTQVKVLLQTALETALQKKLLAQFQKANSKNTISKEKQRPKVQAIFCIDVRSEVFRRHFEATDTGVQTIGFAGFFGFPIEFVPIGHEKGLAQCPVLLTPAQTVSETVENLEEIVKKRAQLRHIKNAWYSFKMGAISCFSFVGPIGLAYLLKLFTDSFGLTRPVEKPSTESLTSHAKQQKKPDVSSIALSSKVELALGALNAMSLTDGFARLVMITGHGSSTVNNPHATGLDCGACAGRTGEANARVAADILNDQAVREALIKNEISIPADTFFLSCQHDTTTDEISFFNANQLPETHKADFDEILKLAKEAAKRTRLERGLRMENANHADIFKKSKDWAQVRPEWGLAGCSNFIVAPRERTQHIDLAGKSFLHSYVWQQDKSFGVLELIMTAPMIVASWISYQYYASTVDNNLYGAGNKTLHNVVGTVGVLEGNTGDLRTGLPMQSIHDGKDYQHEPLRLNVFIEAPIDEINKIIDKHPMVKNLFDNQWLYLFALNHQGIVSHSYQGELNWDLV